MTATAAALDNVTEAEYCLAEALKKSVGDVEREDLIALAHVNATLALAEQQKLANLIAYQASLAELTKSTWPGGETHAAGIATITLLTERIVEGLAL